MWQIIESTVSAEDGSETATFGIENGNLRIYDICTNRREIESFVQRLNRGNASPIHAYDLVEDFLAAI